MPENTKSESTYTIQLVSILRDGKPFAVIGPTYYGLSDKNILEFEAAMLPMMQPILEALMELGFVKAAQKGMSANEIESIKSFASHNKK